MRKHNRLNQFQIHLHGGDNQKQWTYHNQPLGNCTPTTPPWKWNIEPTQPMWMTTHLTWRLRKKKLWLSNIDRRKIRVKAQRELLQKQKKVIPKGWKDDVKEGPLQTTMHQVCIVKKRAWNWRKRDIVVFRVLERSQGGSQV